MARIEILGVQHTYELTQPTSSRQVLVFVHGWMLSRRYWQPLVEQLQGDYQCLWYDLRGFGESQPCHSCIRQDYSPAAYAQDLITLLQKLEISSAWLIGHSLGGTIALWAADQLPEVVKGVVCLNAGGGIYLKEEFERFRAAGCQLVKMRPRWLCHWPLVDFLFMRAQVSRPLCRQWGHQRLVDFVEADTEAALRTLLDSTTEAEVHQLPQIVSRLQQPVYFVAGAEDTIMAPRYVHHLASFHWMFQRTGGNVIEIPQTGHLAMVEQVDSVAAHLQQVLNSV